MMDDGDRETDGVSVVGLSIDAITMWMAALGDGWNGSCDDDRFDGCFGHSAPSLTALRKGRSVQTLWEIGSLWPPPLRRRANASANSDDQPHTHNSQRSDIISSHTQPRGGTDTVSDAMTTHNFLRQ